MGILRKVKTFSVAFTLFLSVFLTLEYQRRQQSTVYEDEVAATRPAKARPTRNRIRTKKPIDAQKPGAVAKRFQQRLAHLQKQCEKEYYPPPSTQWIPNSNFLVDIPRHLLVCAVAKSGSTTWHRTIWAIRQKRTGKSTDQSLYRPEDTLRNSFLATNLSRELGVKLINPVRGDEDFWNEPPPGSSFRIILARHPFARLISGWHQKFMLKSDYWVTLFKNYKILLDYRKNYDESHVMGFKDFAQYLADAGKGIMRFDFHFVPSYVFCRPCAYHYTYILKAESVDIDETWLNKRLNLTDLDIGRRGSPSGGSLVNGDVKENIKKYMSQLHPEVIKKLYAIYERDFAYFGYTFNFTTLEAGGFE